MRTCVRHVNVDDKFYSERVFSAQNPVCFENGGAPWGRKSEIPGRTKRAPRMENPIEFCIEGEHILYHVLLGTPSVVA